MSEKLRALVVSVLCVGVCALPAMAQVTLPQTGVDVADFVAEAIVAVGTIVAVVVGGFFAFLIVRKGVRWARSALG